MKLNLLAPWKKSYDKPRQHIKKQKHHFADKVHTVKAMVSPEETIRSLDQKLDHKEG